MRIAAPLVVVSALAACAAHGGIAAEQPGARTPQEPRYIDQLEPARVGITVAGSVGVGNISARVSGTPLNDRTDATFVKLTGDAKNGAALHAEAWWSDDNLFSGITINDGVAPAPGDASLQGFELFPHVRFDPWRDESLHLLLRVGLFVDWQEIDHDRARVERDWLSLGPKLLFEPIWRLYEGEEHSLDLYGRIGGDIGPAWFTEEYRGGDDRDTTTRWAGELGAGLRAEFGRWHADLGYELHHTTFDTIQSNLFGKRDSTELQRQQIFLGFGIRL